MGIGRGFFCKGRRRRLRGVLLTATVMVLVFLPILTCDAAATTQDDEDLIFEDDGVIRAKRDLTGVGGGGGGDVLPVASPVQPHQDEDDHLASQGVLTRIRRQFFGFFNTDDEDVEGSALEEEGSGDVPRVYRCKIHVTRPWQATYNNKESLAFTTQARNLRQAIEIVLRPIEGEKIVQVSDMSKSEGGYIMVFVDIMYTGDPGRKNNMKRLIRNELEGGFLGTVPVNNQYFSFEEHMDDPAPTPPDGCRGDAQFTCVGGKVVCEVQRCDGTNDCPRGDDEDGCECAEGLFQCDGERCLPNDKKCNGVQDCADNTDEENCQTCPEGHFECDGGSRCVDNSKRCDGRRDCQDNSDEANCPPTTTPIECRPDQFQCNSGVCLEGYRRCDYIDDCPGGEDELGCPCRSGQFQCDDNSCVSIDQRCNGQVDCRDGSDERGCPPDECRAPDGFLCNNGYCIRGSQYCDGTTDCQDGSDEIDCPCRPDQFRCYDGQCLEIWQRCNSLRECRDGDDEAGCPCPSNGFRCESDGYCIREDQKCDGRPDCTDASDERDCRCQGNQWQCRDGACIPAQYRCDGRPDCGDGSDEYVDCPDPPKCRPDEFQCGSGECILDSQVCNQYSDCRDASDERDCPPPNAFLCGDGRYISSELRCNGVPDCSDASDEAGCGPPGTDGLNLKTYPPSQTIQRTREVVFQCRDEGNTRAPVRWMRDNNRPLPPGSTDVRGRLTMPNIQKEHTGTYWCEAQGFPSTTPGRRVSVYLQVDDYDIPTTPTPTVCGLNEATCMNGQCISKDSVCDGVFDCADASDEMRCNPLGCEPNEFQCANKRCVLKTWMCDSDDDCGDQSDENTCPAKDPNSPCFPNEFVCQTGNQCIPKAFHCDGEVDCQDGTDELGCSKPIVIEPPPRNLLVQATQTITLTCVVIGTPTPTVIWRLNWGHVADKCTMDSVQGRGTLTCPNAQPTDQGAYSCEAINSQGSVFAQPDAIVQVTGGNPVCKPPLFNAGAISPQECLNCFCFEATEQCYSTDRFITQLPPPQTDQYTLVGVNQDQIQGNYVIRANQYPLPSRNVRPVSTTATRLNVDRSKLGGPSDLLVYFSLPNSHKGEQLTAYGGYLRYKIVYEMLGAAQAVSGPDVIIAGNNVTLMHVRDGDFFPDTVNQVDVQFRRGQWYKRVVNPGQSAQPLEPASREEIMMALEDLQYILIRALYTDGLYVNTTLSDVQMATAVLSNTGQGRAVLVEECRCPEGYVGLSCQECAPNYRRVEGGRWLGRCVPDVVCGPNEYGDPANGIDCLPCPCPLTTPNNQFSSSCYLANDGQVTCDCQRGYQGRRCEYCAPGYTGNPSTPGDICRPESVTCMTTFTCLDGSIHPWSRRCDGIKDCFSYEDERGCQVCFNSGHRCSDGSCVHFERICDGHVDCNDQSDEDPTNCLDSLPCSHLHQWTCADRTCISRTQHCDGNYDCPDRSDELYCNCTCDDHFHFRCGDGTCLDASLRCNEKVDCIDGSDEFGCSCDSATEHTCGDGTCVNKERVCDGWIDCRDQSDEHGGCNSCDPATSYACVDGTCIDKRRFCDGRVDCSDRSDEPPGCNCDPNTSHQCDDGTCIDRRLVCDGVLDCRDGSDEPPDCPRNCDPRTEFTCRSRECIDSRLVCNGYDDCRDGSDEEFCPICNYDQFQCGDRSCVDRRQLCDGIPDCRDQSDESEQAGCCVGPYFFRCDDGSCIDAARVCNNYPDCRDGKDEVDCQGACNLAGSYSPQPQPNGLCQCKEFAMGARCDQCKAYSFYLNENNRDGCIPCFCMGITQKCASSSWYRQQESVSFTRDRQGFELVDEFQQMQTIDTNDLRVEPSQRELIFTDFLKVGQEVLYWQLPQRFIGNKVSSYGGNLTYTLRYVPAPGGGGSPNSAASVVIYGNDITLKHYSKEPLRPSELGTITVPLYEQYWERQDGQESNREHFMMALADLESVLIKATYTTNSVEVGLQYVSMDYAEPRNTGQPRAYAVEMCECPRGYQGLSCEDCAIGYTRSTSGIHLGTCKPCECNGHSEECDPETGECANCRDNTAGPFCDVCAPGYYMLSDGRCVPEDGSTICNCDESGSVSCDGGRCQCKSSVYGDSCDTCRPGYFHLSGSNPDGCLQCWCSGVTDQCFSSNFYRIEIPMQLFQEHGFSFSNRLQTNVIREGFNINQQKNEIAFTNFDLLGDSETYYWSLPQMFTGNRLTSYGGNLTVTQRYEAQRGGNTYADSDVIIRSSGGQEFIWMKTRPLLLNQEQTYSVLLTETSFTINQRPATRGEFLNALVSVEAILIRATLSDRMRATYLQNVIMDTAVPSQTGQPRALEVEQCSCPREYTGLSCEQCKPGHYREVNNNRCIQCPCNGREESCAQLPDGTIECRCLPGYYGPYCGGSGPPPIGPTSPTVSVTVSEPRILIAARGSTVQFRCSARSLTGPQNRVSVSWSRADGELPYGRATDNRQGVLIIAEVRAADSGTYICAATDGFGRIVTQNATLSIRDGGEGQPRVILQDRRKEVAIGGTLEVRCFAEGSPQPRITWSRGPDRQLPSNVIQQNGVLYFRNAQPSDAGEYYCTASNNQGTSYAIILIDVLDDSAGPVIIVEVSQEVVEVRSGETVRVKCSAGSPGNLLIEWSRRDDILPSQAQVYEGELQIPNARPIDSGVYVCRITDQRTSRYQESSTLITISGLITNVPTVRVLPERQTANQGSSIELRCMATGEPRPSITWEKVNDNFGPSIQVDGEVLRITNAIVSDRGMYVCTATNEGGSAQAAAIVEIERREAPVVEIYPEVRQSTVVGASALFQCHLTAGIPTPSVQWSRTDGRPFTPNTELLDGGVIRFDQLRGDEEGSYTCTAENDAGSVTAVAILLIESMPSITITPWPSPHTVRINDPVRLECTAQGDPAPTVSWEKLDATFPLSLPGRSVTPNMAVYEIVRASKADEGTYQCSARNAAGVSEQRIQLYIQDILPGNVPTLPPPIPGTRPSQPVFVPYGGSYEYECSTTDGDARDLEFSFRRSDGRPLPPGTRTQGGILTLTNVDESASGEYACVATERFTGSILFTIYTTIEVLAPPRITLDPARQIVRPGDLVRIRCSATGAEPITVTWSKESGFMPPSVIINGGELMFRGIETTDAGQYICTAVNRAGTSRAMAEVIVNEEPILTAIEPEVTLYAEQSAELRCEASGINPNDVRWSRVGSRLPDNAQPSANFLRLTNVRPEDSGNYRCEATTSYGTLSSDVITLTVQRQQQFNIRVRSSPPRVRIGEDVQLICEVDGNPAVAVMWSRIDGPLPRNAEARGNVLSLPNVQIGGSYLCTVTTPQGVFEERYGLVIQGDDIHYGSDHHLRSVETRSVQIGQGVTMDCNINLPGPISYTWTKHGSSLPLKAVSQDSLLDIPGVQVEDAGLYVCTGSNNERSVDLPTLLIVTGVVPRFEGRSYLALKTLPNAYLGFDLELSFRPEIPDGLLLYNSQREGPESGDYIALGLKDGYAEFHFNIGAGATIIRSRDPLALNEWHTVKISRNRKEGNMVVDGGEAVMGVSVGRFVGLDLLEPMFLGGVPEFSRLPDRMSFTAGFRGCISRLVIGTSIQNQFVQDANRRVQITSCNSCEANPCLNNGVCQEAYTESGHKCFCPAGFSGPVCENSGEVCYAGVCGTGRCVNRPGGFECYCPFGKLGPRCEQDITIYEPAFGDESYIAYPTPRARRWFSIDLNFKPESLDDGVLMYCAQRESGPGDFASLAIRNQRLEFRYNTGSGTANIQSDPIELGQWIDVHANRSDRLGSMIVNDGPILSGESPGTTQGLNLLTPLFIGGVDSSRIQVMPDVEVDTGFKGCVSQIKLMGQKLALSDALVDSANVAQCGGSGCGQSPCQNNGQCTDDPGTPGGYICSCPVGYSGRNCEEGPGVCTLIQPCRNGAACVGANDNYTCLCPLGFVGRHCEQQVELRDSAHFSGHSWVEFDQSVLSEGAAPSQMITFEFSTRRPNGLLFWLGQEPDVSGRGLDYVSVAVKGGYVEFSYELGGGRAVIRSPTRVDDGRRHKLTVKRTGQEGSLTLDRNLPERGAAPGQLHMLNTRGNVYIGGVPDFAVMTGGLHSRGFHGCLHHLSFDNQPVDRYMEMALLGANVTPCQRLHGGRRKGQGRG